MGSALTGRIFTKGLPWLGILQACGFAASKAESVRTEGTVTEMMMGEGTWESNLMGPFAVRLDGRGDSGAAGSASPPDRGKAKGRR